MITKEEILSKTGISQRALARLQEKGIIQRPVLRPHPSGRGRIGYYPDEVLVKVEQIFFLTKEGHSLYSAATIVEKQLQQERMDKLSCYMDSFDEKTCAARWIHLNDGRKVDILSEFLSTLSSAAEKLLPGEDQQNNLLTRVGSHQLYDSAIGYLSSGYNPVLIYDGDDAHVTPDFMISHALSKVSSAISCLLVIPLQPVITRTYRALGLETNPRIGIKPAAKVNVIEDEKIMECDVIPEGPFGFKLLRETCQKMKARSQR